MANLVWKSSDLENLYEGLVDKYGEFNEANWNSSRPTSVTKEEYDEYLDAVAERVGASSGRAVAQQIAWALTDQTDIGDTYVRTWVVNKSAAYWAGFIGRKLMPWRLTVEYKAS